MKTQHLSSQLGTVGGLLTRHILSLKQNTSPSVWEIQSINITDIFHGYINYRHCLTGMAR